MSDAATREAPRASSAGVAVSSPHIVVAGLEIASSSLTGLLATTGLGEIASLFCEKLATTEKEYIPSR